MLKRGARWLVATVLFSTAASLAVLVGLKSKRRRRGSDHNVQAVANVQAAISVGVDPHLEGVWVKVTPVGGVHGLSSTMHRAPDHGQS
jgi:hypothetical protein